MATAEKMFVLMEGKFGKVENLRRAVIGTADEGLIYC